MGRKVVFIVFLVSWFLGSVVPSNADEVRISVAASMTNAVKDVLREFEAVYPGVVVRLNSGSSGSLAKQIVHGAPVDIFVSANPKWTGFLRGKGKIAINAVRVLAFNTLVVVGDPVVHLSSLNDLATLKRIALGSPGSVPAGQYAKQAMNHAGVYDILLKSNKLVMAKDVRQALLYADRKEVDAAFVYKTDALLAKRAKILFSVPDTFYEKVTYPMALTVSGAGNPSARVFFDFMAKPEAVHILEKFGFEPETGMDEQT